MRYLPWPLRVLFPLFSFCAFGLLLLFACQPPASSACKDGSCPAHLSCVSGECRCPPGQTSCGTTCVDLLVSPLHCGKCDNTCPAHLSCALGRCSCPTGQADCNGLCIDPLTSPVHCGGCGQACSTDHSCALGRCVCPAGLTDCSGACADLQSSRSHCGTCGKACASEEVCNGGSCQSSCPPPRLLCQGDCIDPLTSSQHCGGCGGVCLQAKICDNGRCLCKTGEEDCGKGCIPLTSDNHCGACNKGCSGGKTCQNQQCACPAGFVDCSGTCVDPKTSPENCGGCGQVCLAEAACVAGQCEKPLSLAAGYEHACALTDCNRLSCWGGNSRGQLGISLKGLGSVAPVSLVELLPSLDVAHVVAGYLHTCALFRDKSVRCWGENTSGQLGYGDTNQRNAPPANAVSLGSGRSARKLTAGTLHTCALLDDSTVKCWGYNNAGQLGYGDTTQRNAPISYPIDLGVGRTAKEISAGHTHTCALLDDNTLKCWGSNGFGQLGYGDTTPRNAPPATPVNLGMGRTAKAISAGYDSTCAILDDDTLKCWGQNNFGQLGYGDVAPRNAPPAFSVDVGAGRKVRAVGVAIFVSAPGFASHTCAILDDNTLKCWGSNGFGQLGYGDTTDRSAPPATPVKLGVGRTAKRLTIGNRVTCAVLDDGTVQCWGSNSKAQVEYSSLTQRTQPASSPMAMGFLRCGGVCVSALEKTRCGTCQTACSGQEACFFGRCLPAPKQVAGGAEHACLLLDNSTAKCWGQNNFGQLGYGDTTPRNAPDPNPVNLGGGRTAKTIATNLFHTCAILDDNTLNCWGENNDGQLGYGDTTDRNAPISNPVNLGVGRTAKAISAGYDSTCAVLDNGTVKCWGDNSSGQLGYGDTTDRNAPDPNPVNLGGGRTAKSIVAGGRHTCAILDDNTLKCWGYNGSGQLGYGDTTSRTVPAANPVNLGTGRTAKSVVATFGHTCAVLDNDTLKCWGENIYGELGYGDFAQRNAPVAVPANLGVGRTAKSVAVGGNYTCAVLDNNTVKCWGDNGRGQLGYGDTLERTAPAPHPVNLGVGRTAMSVVVGSGHTCAVLDNNIVKCWGDNRSGQLGYGDKADRTAPDDFPIRLP